MSDYQEGGPVHVAAMEFRIHQLEQENERLKLSVQARDAIIDHGEGRETVWADMEQRYADTLNRLSAAEERYRDEALRAGRLAADLERAEEVVEVAERVVETERQWAGKNYVGDLFLDPLRAAIGNFRRYEEHETSRKNAENLEELRPYKEGK